VSRPNFDRPAAAYAGLVLATLFWAGNAITARAVAGQIPPLAFSFWRWALALLIILPFGLRPIWESRASLRAHWKQILLLGTLSVGGYNTLLYLAAQTTTAVNITLVSATIPVMIALMAWLLLRQPTTLAQLGGIAASFAGIVVIVSQGSWSALAGLDFRPGDLIMIGAVAAWALYSVLLRRHAAIIAPIHPVGFLTMTIIAGLPILLLLYLWEMTAEGVYLPSAQALPAIIGVALFAGIFAYLLWNRGIALVGPSTAGMFIYCMPLFTAALANLFLDERLYGFHAMGGGLILAGLFLATRQPSPRPRAQP
jgi:drug/metabolite transporter (DMT)-like permease